jgi:hypothetical protein
LESAKPIYESEMALFSECMQLCAQIVLDIADIVRDGDLSPVSPVPTVFEAYNVGYER